MDQKAAVAKLRKLLGSGFAYRTNPKALTGELREQAVANSRAALQAAKEAEVAAAEKREAILAADTEYQRMLAEAKALRRAAVDASSVASQRRVTVGLDRGWCFSVQAEGDNWQEVVDAVATEKRAA